MHERTTTIESRFNSSLCHLGWSYGGYVTALSLSTSSIFQCGISVAPVTNWKLYGECQSSLCYRAQLSDKQLLTTSMWTASSSQQIRPTLRNTWVCPISPTTIKATTKVIYRSTSTNWRIRSFCWWAGWDDLYLTFGWLLRHRRYFFPHLTTWTHRFMGQRTITFIWCRAWCSRKRWRVRGRCLNSKSIRTRDTTCQVWKNTCTDQWRSSSMIASKSKWVQNAI